jgi:hypothetical protein
LRGGDSCYFDRILNPVCSPIFRGDFDTEGWNGRWPRVCTKTILHTDSFLRIVSGCQRPRTGFDDPPTCGRAGRCIRAHCWSSQFRYSNSFGWTRMPITIHPDHVLGLAPYSASIKAARSLATLRLQSSIAAQRCCSSMQQKSHSVRPGMKRCFDPLCRRTCGCGAAWQCLCRQSEQWWQ